MAARLAGFGHREVLGARQDRSLAKPALDGKSISCAFFPMYKTGLLRAVARFLPEGQASDALVAFLLFVYRHRRLPDKNRKLLNDVLYSYKTGRELRDPLRVFTTDKEYLKLYVGSVVGDLYNVPTIAVINNIEELGKFRFPSDCCVKPTHLSGEVVFVSPGGPADCARMNGWFKANHYSLGRESNYHYLRPKIIVEPLIFGKVGPRDLKVFCYKGRPRIIQVDVDRFSRHTRMYYDIHWVPLPFSIIYDRADVPEAEPENLAEILRVCARLSQPFDLVRIDCYTNGRQCFVGEITHCSENAGGVFIPRKAEEEASRILFSD